MDRAALIEQVLERAATYPQEHAHHWTTQGHSRWVQIEDDEAVIAAFG